jgi:hypothetical protein
VLDEKVLDVLERLRQEDARRARAGVARELRAGQLRDHRPVPLLPRLAAERLRGAGGRRLARVLVDLARGRVRILGGRVLSLEHDPAKCEAWRRNVADAGLEEWAELVEGDAFETLPEIEDGFDVVFIDAEKEDYERLFALARPKLEPGGLVVADNVLSHEEALGVYSRARQTDPTLVSVTVPLDRGLELSAVLSDTLE